MEREVKLKECIVGILYWVLSYLRQPKYCIFLLSYCLMCNYLGESPNMAVTMLNPRVIRAL